MKEVFTEIMPHAVPVWKKRDKDTRSDNDDHDGYDGLPQLLLILDLDRSEGIKPG